ncbi:carbohydrate ABC transporter permease [Andreprevotia chitinilytica]|uniref:carbohydrate ABC transporter permease n=1 Tax=Andreprevotia chitinilytica TaxID=396808 RepID=UPI00054F18F6|nr:sugar ABC transporter permease [Andreprevotia chitinilytica]
MAKPGVGRHTGYLFIAPFLIPFAVFSLWPLLYNMWLSLHDYFVTEHVAVWNGFANYVTLAESDSFPYALRNSLLFLLVVPVIQVVALGLALLVQRPLVGIGLFRAIYYVPVVIAISVAGVVWRHVFEYDGMFSWLLITLHIIPEGVDWIGLDKLSLYAAMLFSTWKNVGYYMVLYLAGLQTVPKALLDAAELDGAGAWMRFRHVTLPALQPIVLLCTLLTTIGALKAFQEILVLTHRTQNTVTMLMWMYSVAFGGGNGFGLAAAVAVLVMVLCFAIAAVQFRVFGARGIWGKGT